MASNVECCFACSEGCRMAYRTTLLTVRMSRNVTLQGVEALIIPWCGMVLYLPLMHYRLRCVPRHSGDSGQKMSHCHGLQWVHAAVHTIVSSSYGLAHSTHVHSKQALQHSQPHLNYLDYSLALYQQSYDAHVVPHNSKTLLRHPPASCLAFHVWEPVKVQVQRQSQKHS